MADIFVRSTDGSDVDNGSTWALAKATLAGAAAIDAAGDNIYVSDNHSESTNASITHAFAGVDTSAPVRILCVDDTGDPSPPTALAATAVVATGAGAYNITLNGHAYFYGMTFRSGVGSASTAAINLNAASSGNSVQQVYEQCSFEIATTGASSEIRLGTSNTPFSHGVLFKNCSVKFAAAGQSFSLYGGGLFEWRGGSLLSGGTSPNTLIEGGNGYVGMVIVDGVDLSNAASTINLVDDYSYGRVNAVFRNCKLPVSWTGSLVVNTRVGTRVEMYNCDSGDTNYKLWIQEHYGSTRDETTIVRTGGASDGTTTLSWKMATGSSGGGVYPTGGITSPEIVIWNDTTGSAKTLTVEVVTDNVTLTDAECWLEVEYLGTSGVPLALFADDAKANILATAANQTSSSETWTTTGLTTPVKQKLSVTMTPQEKGFFIARVRLAKASTTVYVDPELTVS